MHSAWRAATLLLVAGSIAGAVYLIAPDKTKDQPATAVEALNMQNSFSLSSHVFEKNGTIPSKYTCDDQNINPPLLITGIPENTVSLTLIMDDPDIPQQIKDERGIDTFDHWLVYNISPEVTVFAEGIESVGQPGLNGRGEAGYIGPCPPPEYEPTEHRYFFKLYALDTKLSFPKNPTKAELMEAMEGHIISQTELIGLYDRSESVSDLLDSNNET
jgi:Raf kinase inhibitor-like YbhB/YbcL family protein